MERLGPEGGEELHDDEQSVKPRCELCIERDALLVVLVVRPGRSERGCAVCGGCFVNLEIWADAECAV